MNINPTSEDQVGSYDIALKAYLADYEEVEDAAHKPADLEFSMNVVIDTGINDPPYFEESLTNYLSVQVNTTRTSTSW